jgi:anaerobic magnesium-protoporphyrin IX monomethyl ester cyclase
LKILFVLPRDAEDFGHKPVGISILSAIAKRCGYETRLMDTGLYKHEYSIAGYEEQFTKIGMFKPVEHEFSPITERSLADITRDYLYDFNPDIVSISLYFPFGRIAKEIARVTKHFNPEITIIMGGPQVTADPESALRLGADYVNVGEGTVSWEKILKGDDDIDATGNIGYMDDMPVFNPLLPLGELNSLPPLDYSIYEPRHFLKSFDGKVYRGGDHMITWGCPNQCSYCINHHYRDIYKSAGHSFHARRYSLDIIIEELRYLKERHDLNFFKFCDENFLLMPEDVLDEFAGDYRDNVALPFTTAVHPKTVTEEKIQLLKAAGCVSLSIGIENGNPEYREKVLRRSDSIEDVLRAFRLTRKHGIRTMSFNMGATPFYTREMYEETIELNRRAQPDVATMSLYMPLPGTALAETAKKYGFLEDNWQENIGNDYLNVPMLKFPDLSSEEITEMRNDFNRRIQA